MWTVDVIATARSNDGGLFPTSTFDTYSCHCDTDIFVGGNIAIYA